nr:uncharacterized protein LOC110569538 [Aotus nancymaae]
MTFCGYRKRLQAKSCSSGPQSLLEYTEAEDGAAGRDRAASAPRRPESQRADSIKRINSHSSRTRLSTKCFPRTTSRNPPKPGHRQYYRNWVTKRRANTTRNLLCSSQVWVQPPPPLPSRPFLMKAEVLNADFCFKAQYSLNTLRVTYGFQLNLRSSSIGKAYGFGTNGCRPRALSMLELSGAGRLHTRVALLQAASPTAVLFFPSISEVSRVLQMEMQVAENNLHKSGSNIMVLGESCEVTVDLNIDLLDSETK